MELIFYQSARIPVKEFIKNLETSDRAKVLACLKSIEEMGSHSPRVQFRQIKGKLWEIKIRAATTGYRIFYVMIKNNKMVLLHAYKKQSQRAPIKELAIAEKRLEEVLNHENSYIN